MNNEVDRTSITGYRSYLLLYWSAYGTWYLDRLAAVALCLWSSMLKEYSFSLLLLCVKYFLNLLIINSTENSPVASCLSFVQQYVCTWYLCFLLRLSKTARVGTFFRQSTAQFVWKYSTLQPPSKPFYRSILITIDIVIDQPYLGPVAIRSHLLALLY